MSGHTPGPWVAVDRGGYRFHVDRQEEPVCRVVVLDRSRDGNGYFMERCAADARLIAAAPESHAALIRAEEHLDLIMRCYNLTSGDYDATKFVRDSCRAAIAKTVGPDAKSD